MKRKGFMAGLAGGALAAAAVVLLLVFVFDLGDVNKTIIQATPETPTVYSTPATTTGELSPDQIYENLSGGVVMVLSDFGGSGTDQFGQAAERPGARHGLRRRRRGLHPHQRPRRRRERPARQQRDRGVQQGRLRDAARPRRACRRRRRQRRRRHQGRPRQGRPQASAARRLGQGRRRRARRGDRQPAGLQLLHHRGNRVRDRPQPAGPERPDHPERYPDGRRHQPGQLRRTAHRQRRARSSASTSRSPRQGGGNDGLGFAVPINTAVRSLEQIKANGKGAVRLDGRRPPDAHQ